MPWINKAKAVIQSWYAGQEYGNALVDVLTGATNPSGKLPTTFPVNLSDTPAFESYPGKNLQMDYDEKLLVGYKWYDKNLIEPLFPFGHGLSYTEFEYSELKIKKSMNDSFICSYIRSKILEILPVLRFHNVMCSQMKVTTMNQLKHFRVSIKHF